MHADTLAIVGQYVGLLLWLVKLTKQINNRVF